MAKGIGGHTRAYQGRTDEWLTPPDIIEALSREPYGPFDLDPCAPDNRPWDTANNHFTYEDDGLAQPWFGRVWLNPPYGPQTEEWLERMSRHNSGIALIFARTETSMFFKFVWEHATAVLFIKGRLHFYTIEGQRSPNNSGGPSVLIAYGDSSADCLERSGIAGKFVRLKPRSDNANLRVQGGGVGQSV